MSVDTATKAVDTGCSLDGAPAEVKDNLTKLLAAWSSVAKDDDFMDDNDVSRGCIMRAL